MRFVIKFAVFLAILNLILLLPWVDAYLVYPWTVLNARWAVSLANLTEEGYVAQGTLVRAGWRQVSVEVGCNGVEAVALCVSAILAFPAPWKRRILGILMGIVGVFALNLIRLANLFIVERHFPQYSELFHVYIWQTLIAAMALGLFLIWGRFIAGGFAIAAPAGGSSEGSAAVASKRTG